MKYVAGFDMIAVHIKYIMIFIITHSNINRDTLALRIHTRLDSTVGQGKSDTSCVQPCSVRPGFHFRRAFDTLGISGIGS